MGDLISLKLRRDRRPAFEKNQAEIRRALLPLGWVCEVSRMDAHQAARSVRRRGASCSRAEREASAAARRLIPTSLRPELMARSRLPSLNSFIDKVDWLTP